MSEKKNLAQERSQIYSAFFNNKLPKRLPVEPAFPNSIIAEYGVLDPISYQYDFTLLAKPAEALCEKIYSDACPYAFNSKVWILSR